MEPRSRTHRPSHLAPAHSRAHAGDNRPTDPPADLTGVEIRPPHLGSAAPAPHESDVLTDERAAECSDSGLIAAIRDCEAMRRRFLHDQLTLLTEARRRGLRLSGGPRRATRDPADAEGTPT